ncbi:MAG: hypothetical protein AMXMBFR48_15310 [Ignavibacteriales bacterium]
MKIDNTQVGIRLKEFGKEKFGQLKVFAENLGISQQSLTSAYLSGRSLPGAELLLKLVNMGCDITWLLTGQERTSPPAPLLDKERGAGDGKERGKGGFEYPVVSIIGAGEVIPFDNEVEEYVLFPYKHKNCVALRVQGDSMIPFIEDGDIVLVDLVKRPNQGDIVAVRTKAGEQFVKKLMVVERNKKTFHLFSLNPAYPLRAFNFDEVETVKKVVMILKDTDYEEN